MKLADLLSGALQIAQHATGTADFDRKINRLLDMPVAEVQATLLEYVRDFSPIQRASFQAVLQAAEHERSREVRAMGTLFEGLKLQHPDFIDGPLASEGPRLVAQGLDDLRRARADRPKV